MSLKHVVLAVLADAPGHGYEIHDRLLEYLPLGRPCDRSRVYAVLVALEQDGLTCAWLQDMGRGRVRKRYGLAPAGQRSLQQWLARPRPGLDLTRRSLLLRLAVMEWLDGRPAGGADAKAWREVLTRRERRWAELRRELDRGDLLRDLLRARELGHLEAEIEALRAWKRT